MSPELSFGIAGNGQTRTGTRLDQAFEDHIEVIHRARDLGFDSVIIGQHYLTTGLQMMQPYPFAGRIAAETGDMRLMLGILLLAFQNPVDAAENIASLDAMTGGRMTVGVGLGYRELEYNAFGIDKKERIARFEQNLAVVKALWSGSPTSADLPWCRLDDVELSILPVQRPRPPVLLAANSDAAVRRAARLGDGWFINPHARLEVISRQMELFAEERRHAGLPPADTAHMPLAKEMICAATTDEARTIAEKYVMAKYDSYASWGQDKANPGNDSFSVPFDELADQRFIYGTPDECIAGLLRWHRALGTTSFVFRVQYLDMPRDVSLRLLELMAAEVMPALRAEIRH
jgi:alkanesulfonate monooxygenase SsuD/methylene tetrahydromethanopterin reductase-like flavin-dependent oxidoreductase (luciferase family)